MLWIWTVLDTSRYETENITRFFFYSVRYDQVHQCKEEKRYRFAPQEEKAEEKETDL